MKLNENTALLAPQILLVPYDPHHVRTYHQWMEDPHLRESTASQALTIEEELSMQRSWREDGDKLTFIAVIPPEEACGNFGDGVFRRDVIVAGKDDEPSRMIGDVNLFFFEGEDEDDDEDYDEDTSEEEEGNEEDGGNMETATSQRINPPTPPSVTTTPVAPQRLVTGELEVMIALPHQQSRGLGTATLLLFLSYILRHIDTVPSQLRKSDEPYPPRLSAFRAKIAQTNFRSLRLFERLGFKRRRGGKVNYFGEYEMVVELLGEEGLRAYRSFVDGLLVRYGLEGWRECRYVREQQEQVLNERLMR